MLFEFLALFVAVAGFVRRILAPWLRWFFAGGCCLGSRADAATAAVAGGGIYTFSGAC